MKVYLFTVLLTSFCFAQYGPELVDEGFPYTAWTAYGTNTVTDGGNGYVDITYVDNASGAYANITNAGGLSTNLTNGADYYLSGRGYWTGGSVNIRVYNGSGYEGLQALPSSDDAFSIEFTCQSAADVVMNCANMFTSEVGHIYLNSVKQKLDTIYIDAANGDDSNLGDLNNPVATYSEVSSRGLYDGGVVAYICDGNVQTTPCGYQRRTKRLNDIKRYKRH